jgi:AcrR family transcriptional regulator
MESDDLEEARILDTATTLFAELGFDGTSLSMVAEAAGIAPDALAAKVESKTALFTQVMLREQQSVVERLKRIPAVLTPTRQGFARGLDIFLDTYADHPQMLKLWMQHRLGDAADLGDVEGRALLPAFSWYADLLREHTPEDLDIDYIIWSIRWLVEGFLTGGIMHSSPERHPDHPREMHITPEDLEDFREFLKQVVQRILPLPEETFPGK